MTSAQLLRSRVPMLMDMHGDTQTSLAKALRLTQPQVSKKLTGRSQWTLDDCDRLADAYGIATWHLFGSNIDFYEATEHLRRRRFNRG